MCGIAGIISLDAGRVRLALERADRVQSHRGPDGNGFRVEKIGPWSVGLAHRRLSIIDLSESGSQPMSTAGGARWVIYNGELYNYREIRAELAATGRKFNGASDTEVLLEAFEAWGDEAVTRFNGMWAFAWLDSAEQRLVLSRDRLGVKPLHIYRSGDTMYFASEIKAILEMSGQRFELDRQVAAEYAMQSLLDTSERTFFEGIVKLPAGSVSSIDLRGDTLKVDTRIFWRPTRAESQCSEAEAAEQIRALLMDAVRLRLRSDVPVGVLLSGGIDSSSIAACMHAELGADANLNLLSAVSDGGRFDESPFIDMMAAHLGRPVNKVVLDLDSHSALELLGQVCWFNDEPVGGFSNVAHYLLMQRARDLGITVILSGQGADETFCGYRKFLGFHLQTLLRGGHWLRAVREFADFARAGTVLSQFSLHEARRYLPGLFSSQKLGMAGDAIADFTPVATGLMPGADLRDRQIADVLRFSIPILTHYEDRMSMAWSREVRTPFLDFRLVDAALALPAELKLRRGWTKYSLRRAMEPLLPAAIAWRKDKQNFVSPQSEWLKSDLRDAVLGILRDPNSAIFRTRLFAQRGMIELYERYCRQPVDGGSVSFKHIFQPLALELWLRKFAGYLAVN